MAKKKETETDQEQVAEAEATEAVDAECNGSAPSDGSCKSPGIFTRALYTSSYCLSYGVVFPSMLIGRTVPVPKSIREGIVAGAHSAAADVDPFKNKARDMYVGVSKSIGEKVEKVQDSIAERRHRKIGAAQPAIEAT